jgi:AraC-like DNA-binding protein
VTDPAEIPGTQPGFPELPVYEGVFMGRIHPIFLRYILVFCFFSLLILLLFVPVYFYVSDFTRNNELAFIENKLRSGIELFDSTIKGLNNAALITGIDTRFNVFKSDTLKIRGDFSRINPYALTELQNTFRALLLPYPLIADVGILFSQDVILTPQRMFCYSRFYSFYDQFLKCGEYPYGDWVNLLISERPYFPVETYRSSDYGIYEAITFTVRQPGSGPGNQNILYATLPVRNILPLLSDDGIAEQGFARIYDAKGNLLFEKDNLARGKVHLLAEQSTVSQLRFEIGVPDTIIQKQLVRVRNLILLFALIAAALTILLSFLFAYESSAPIRSFLTRIDGTKNIGSKVKGGGPLSFRRLFSDLAESITAADVKLETSLRTIAYQADMIRTQTMDRALQRGLYDPQERENFLSLFPGFPEKYQLANVRYEAPRKLSFRKTAEVQLNLKNLLKAGLEQAYIQSVDRDMLIMILPVSGEAGDWYSRLRALGVDLMRQIDLTLNFSLSDIFDKPSDLPKAWQQLQLIRVLPDINHLIGVEQMKTVPAPQLPLSIDMLLMICNALRNANDAGAVVILGECAALLPEPEDPMLSELTFSMLSAMIVQLKTEYPALLQDIPSPVYARGNQRDLFGKQFPECFHRISERIRSQKEDNVTRFGRQILDFINEHFCEQGLYITMAADHFGISPPTLQKMVKSMTGQTFLAYVEKQRLQKACQMLSGDNCTIQEAATGCGFANANSFYKAFKRVYGYPPSNIRGPL